MIDKHTMQVVDGSSGAFTDRVILGVLTGVATIAGGGAGSAVTTAITFSEPLPATYSVFATSNLATTVNITAKTSAGFNVVTTPVLAATTLGVGLLDVLVLA
jgi:hypothetical protein